MVKPCCVLVMSFLAVGGGYRFGLRTKEPPVIPLQNEQPESTAEPEVPAVSAPPKEPETVSAADLEMIQRVKNARHLSVREWADDHAMISLIKAHRKAESIFVSENGFGVGRVTVTKVRFADSFRILLGEPENKTIAEHSGWLPHEFSVKLQPSNARVLSSDNAWELGINHIRKGEVLSFSYDRDAVLRNPRLYGMGLLHSSERSYNTFPNTRTWNVYDFDLVGVLEHEVPRVYLSKEIPSMNAPKAAPTRPLNAFETAALEKLRGGEDLVVLRDINSIKMLGAIRCSQRCMECHKDAEVDQLLGAFTWWLMAAPEYLKRRSRPDR